MKGEYAVSPYKYVNIGGKRKAWITFPTKQKALNFIKKRRLKKALLYKRKKI